MEPVPLEILVGGTPVSDQTRNRHNRARWIEEVRERARVTTRSLPGWSSDQLSPLMVTIFYFPLVPLPGDIDNLVKPILDGMKGVAYVDDGQIEKLIVQKFEPGIAWIISAPSAALATALGPSKPALYIRLDTHLGWRSIP